MPRVFISYRRDDSAAHAGRIYDRLRDHFGAEQVFRDIDAITPGAKFAKVIAERIENCDALIAIIGTDWLHAEDGEGKRRLDDPDDWVKAEIREALTRDKLVIPALVEGARMPKASELPTEIAALAGCHAIEISESRFDDDAERLLGAVAREAASDAQPAKRSGGIRNRINVDKRLRTVSSLVKVITALVVAFWPAYVHFSAPEKPSQAVAASQGGIAAGGNVTAAPGGVVNTGLNTTINIGITLEQYDAGLKRREQVVLAELAQANRADQPSVTLLEKELAAVEAKRQNLEQSLVDHKAKLAEAHQALEKLKDEVPADQLAQAQQALQKGDAAAAEKLFGDVVQSGKQQAAEAAFQLGKLATNRIDYAKAYEHYSDAARLQPDNPIYLNLAGLLARDLGSYSDAQPFFEKALKIREKSLGPEHPDVATSLGNLASLHHAQGQYAQAEPLYQRALKIREKSLGPEHPDVAQSLNNLAALYASQGQYAQAEPLYQRALKIHEKSLGPEHPDTATSLNNLALLYYFQGRYARVKPLYQRALKIREKSLGPDHPDVAQSLNNLALLYCSQGQYAQAEPLYQRALKIYEKSLGPEHPLVATSLNNLALLYDSPGQYAQAEPLYQRALKIREKSLGPEHPDVAQSLNNLAVLYKTQGQYAKAEPLYQRALKINEKSLGSDHPLVANSLNNLALLYKTQGQYAQAEPLYQRALNILQKSLPADHPNLATGMENYADLLDKLGRKEEAQQWQAKAEAARQLHAQKNSQAR